MQDRISNETDTLAVAIKTTQIAGGFIALMFIALFVFWSVGVSLPQAVLATGFVRSATPNIEVQHSDTSVIKEVAIAEGARVKRGDVLMQMDVEEHHMHRDHARRNLAALRLEYSRLQADLDGRNELLPTPDLEREIHDLQITHLLDHERDHLALTLEERARREVALQASATGLSETNDRLQDRLGFEAQQIAKAESVARSFERLRAGGRIKATELERVQRTYLGLQATAAETNADLARTQLALTEIEHKKAQLSIQHRLATMSRLSEIERLIVQHQTNLDQSNRRIRAAQIHSPVDGTVLNLRYANAGALVPRLGTLLELVPDQGDLMFELNVAPNDVDRLEVGQEAEVNVRAYDGEDAPRFQARVHSISADTLNKSRDGVGTYKVRLLLTPDTLERLGRESGLNVNLRSGMPVDVQIETGQTTLAAYLIAPLRETMRQSFRD